MVKETLDYMGDTYQLELRPVRGGGHYWSLKRPEGCPLTSRTARPVDLETARRQARAYLRRTWPFGRYNPFGESDTARKVIIRDQEYVLLLRAATRGRYYWALYTTDGIACMYGADMVTSLDYAEPQARTFKGEQ